MSRTTFNLALALIIINSYLKQKPFFQGDSSAIFRVRGQYSFIFCPLALKSRVALIKFIRVSGGVAVP